MMKKIVVLLMAALCFAAMSGCNAWRGAGKDVEKTGQQMQKK